MERSSRVLSGALLCCSILPPTWSRNVRSVVSTTRAAGSTSIAAMISSQWPGSRASTVMSRSVWWSSTMTRSTEPIVPPASPIALATRPSMPGLCSISTRIVSEYWADGVATTPLTLLGRPIGRNGQSGGRQGMPHRRLRGLSEQPARQQRAGLEQLVEGAENVVGRRRATAERRVQLGLAHELADERAADGIGAGDELLARRIVEVDALRIEVHEPRARRCVGERDLQREVDPPGACRERGLDDVGPVGRQQEQQVGVLVDALHLVEEVEQRAAGARAHRPLGRHEVDVLEDDGGRGELARHAHGLLDQPQPVAGQQDRRAPRHGAEEVAHRERLSGARRPVEEHAALEVAARRPQALGVARDAGRVRLEPLERALRQDHTVEGDRRQRVEAHVHRTVVALVQRDDLAAEDVVLAHGGADRGEPGGPRLALRRDALEPDRGAVGALDPRDDCGERRAVVAREVHAVGDARDDAPVADLDIGVLDRAGRDGAARAAAGEELAQADAHHDRLLGRLVAEHVGVGRDRVEGELHVRVVARREARGRRRHLARVGPEVVADARGEPGLGRVRRRGHRLEELLERRGEAPDVRQLAAHALRTASRHAGHRQPSPASAARARASGSSGSAAHQQAPVSTPQPNRAPQRGQTAGRSSVRGMADGDRPEELFLIDGNSLVYRAFFALPESIATSTGFPTNAIFGFASMLVKLLTDNGVKPTVVVWDRGSSGRKDLYEEYKGHRPRKPDLLGQQYPHIQPLVEAFGYTNYGVEGYEADDVIATLTEQAKAAGIPVTVVTGDRDAFQLVGDGVRVMATSRGITETKMYDADDVRERYGIGPELIPDFYGLKGDTSDNIPGVPGIGDKTASDLLQRFGSLEA